MRAHNLVPRVLSYPPYGAREGVEENPGNEIGERIASREPGTKTYPQLANQNALETLFLTDKYLNGEVESLFWIKLAAKTVDEDPASCKRWISRKEIKSAKI